MACQGTVYQSVNCQGNELSVGSSVSLSPILEDGDSPFVFYMAGQCTVYQSVNCRQGNELSVGSGVSLPAILEDGDSPFVF